MLFKLDSLDHPSSTLDFTANLPKSFRFSETIRLNNNWMRSTFVFQSMPSALATFSVIKPGFFSSNYLWKNRPVLDCGLHTILYFVCLLLSSIYLYIFVRVPVYLSVEAIKSRPFLPCSQSAIRIYTHFEKRLPVYLR